MNYKMNFLFLLANSSTAASHNDQYSQTKIQVWVFLDSLIDSMQYIDVPLGQSPIADAPLTFIKRHQIRTFVDQHSANVSVPNHEKLKTKVLK